jgi:AcrR family transcriptional regulator
VASERSLTARLSGDERRAAILAAARGAFARHGFHGASTAAIAGAAGCSEPMLYKHFGSKQELFAAVLAESGLQVKARVHDAIAGADDPLAALLGVTRELMTDPGFHELARLRALAIPFAGDPAIREVLRLSAHGQRDTVARAVREAQARGAVRDDVDPEAVGWLAVSCSLLAAYRAAVEGPDGKAGMPDVLSTLMTLLTHPKEER